MVEQHTLGRIGHSGDTIDVIADLADFLKGELASCGHAVNSAATNGEVIDQFVRMRHRWIVSRRRTVHLAAGFVASESDRAGFEGLIGAVTNGDDLLPYQSTLMRDASFNDGMLNDWGIHHFHIGIGPHPKVAGFNARSGPVVYAVVTDHDFYVVTIDQHQRWTMRSLLETIHANWPKLIARYRVEGTLSHDVSESEHKQLRDAQINIAVTLGDGSIYLGPGGGATLAATSMAAKMDAIDLTSALRSEERNWRKTQRSDQGVTPARLVCSWSRGKLLYEIRPW